MNKRKVLRQVLIMKWAVNDNFMHSWAYLVYLLNQKDAIAIPRYERYMASPGIIEQEVETNASNETIKEVGCLLNELKRKGVFSEFISLSLKNGF